MYVSSSFPNVRTLQQAVKIAVYKRILVLAVVQAKHVIMNVVRGRIRGQWHEAKDLREAQRFFFIIDQNFAANKDQDTVPGRRLGVQRLDTMAGLAKLDAVGQLFTHRGDEMKKDLS